MSALPLGGFIPLTISKQKISDAINQIKTIIHIRKASQRKTNILWYHLYLDSKKRIQMNLFAEQKQTHTFWKQTYGYQRGKGGWRDGLGVWDWHKHTAVCGMIGQWGPVVQHRELCPILCDNLYGKRTWKIVDVYTCNWITLSYSSNYRNIVNQIYFNKT